MPNIAIVIKNGHTKAYMPTFERGDQATQLFAKDSQAALYLGGISIAHSENPDLLPCVVQSSISSFAY